jgi:type III pantothenate kinase
LAVDIGNTRIKLGLFDKPITEGELPHPSRWLGLDTDEWDPVEIAVWLAPFDPPQVDWHIASVHRPAAARLAQWLEQEQADCEQLNYRELPLVIDLPAPQEVGIDRLLGAVAANTLRGAQQGAIVADVGSAITVDMVSAVGTFCGGAILPGVRMAARALHDYTDLLPEVPVASLADAPPVLGTSTKEAISSGLFWGAVGAMRTLIEGLASEMEGEPLVLLTGGAAEQIARLLPGRARYVPHLVLAGIALAAIGE